MNNGDPVRKPVPAPVGHGTRASPRCGRCPSGRPGRPLLPRWSRARSVRRAPGGPSRRRSPGHRDRAALVRLTWRSVVAEHALHGAPMSAVAARAGGPLGLPTSTTNRRTSSSCSFREAKVDLGTAAVARMEGEAPPAVRAALAGCARLPERQPEAGTLPHAGGELAVRAAIPRLLRPKWGSPHACSQGTRHGRGSSCHCHSRCCSTWDWRRRSVWSPRRRSWGPTSCGRCPAPVGGPSPARSVGGGHAWHDHGACGPSCLPGLRRSAHSVGWAVAGSTPGSTASCSTSGPWAGRGRTCGTGPAPCCSGHHRGRHPGGPVRRRRRVAS